jgi:hypothetical protein
MERNQERALLTIAAVRQGPDGKAQYLFNERARIYTLTRETRSGLGPIPSPAAEGPGGEPVDVTLDLEKGTILQIAPPSAEARAARGLEPPPLEKPERVASLNLRTIDPTVFNYVEISQRWSIFSRCTNVVPDYSKAKDIFDTCAALSCHLPTPPATPPCIPFQYVADGCYARAHQMRRLISKKWGYCVEKVFSFANQNNDTLAVRADKWGGCCVTWWYHVAPLLRVRLKLTLPGHAPLSLTTLMVIDPGMFDRPVLLSSWLAAQETGSCSRNANVSSYSIQAGSAYAPANYAGTNYSTDPNYTSTEATLNNYSNLTTCR